MPKIHNKNNLRFSNMRITTTFSITLVLFVIGLLAFTFILANKISIQTRENVAVTLILRDSTNDIEKERLENYLSIAPYIKSYQYISKEDALNEYINDLGEDPSSFLGFNPLLASYELKMQAAYAHNDSLKNISQRLQTFDIIFDVSYQKDILQLLNQNIYRIRFIFTCIVAVLLFIAIVLMNNTIRLSIYSKRFIINTMKLVGAKPSFIRRPFIWQSIYTGIIASFLAFGALVGAIFYLQKDYTLFKEFLSTEYLIPIAGCIFIVGIFITWFSALFAVNKYIRTTTDKLYY
ncbi:MAG: permease-like cell division protein FtsX [Paludibacteraceae bacterium]|nr:permease-like cell division protein FtsX [Paludibacteraceae bacterium]MBR5468929.1 permease-like cell division protein FtsX [Paludibacteraceae bacterium]